MSKVTDKKINFNEIYETINKVKEFKIPTKIKMKKDYYDRLATEVQKYGGIIETRDVKMQPLNTIYGLKIIVDNTINKDWEVVYE